MASIGWIFGHPMQRRPPWGRRFAPARDETRRRNKRGLRLLDFPHVGRFAAPLL